jgi:hypothetical protein
MSVTEPLRFAGMAGISIAGRDAAPWVTDFLNAACYRREDREAEDLRLAFCILTTYWWRKQRRLHINDLPAFHGAFGRERLAGRGRIDRAGLLAGGDRLLGDWFSAAYADDARRAWGIAFPDRAERDAYVPERRLELAPLGPLTPEQAPPDEQVWHTYDPVELPSAERAVAALSRPETWPDYATELGRFTPLRSGGLDGQTFEIEVAAGTASGRPVFTRGYVTVTRLATDPGYFAEVEDGLAAHGGPRALPEGATPVLGVDLTTHAGHFMGAGHNRLLLHEHDGRFWVRAVGTWDPMPWHLAKAYETTGRAAQQAFWTPGPQSMLGQLAEAIT